MADVHSKEIRSYNMRCIKGENTKPEMLVRKFLFANSYRYKHSELPAIAERWPGKTRGALPA